MTRINFYIPDPMLAKMQTLATKQDVALAELIRKAIEQFLKSQ
jgi:predicted transcriptional regulator